MLIGAYDPVLCPIHRLRCWAEETSIRLADRVKRDAETAAESGSAGSDRGGDGEDVACAADGDWFTNTKSQDRGLAAIALGGWRDRADVSMVDFITEADLAARSPEAFHATYIGGNRTVWPNL